MVHRGLAESYSVDAPSEEVWYKRSEFYMYLVGEAMGNAPVARAQQTLNLERELERAFCAGAWVAAVTLAAAVVEIHVFGVTGKSKRAVDTYLATEELKNEWEWLRLRRNRLLHPSQNDSSLPDCQFIWNREELADDAMRAIKLALHVFFTETRNYQPASHKNPGSS